MTLRREMIGVYVVRPSENGRYEFLQLLRERNDYLGGTWAAVYGGADDGEPAWQAALRELREETGLAPREFFRAPSTLSFYTYHDDTIWSVIAFCAIVDRDAAVTLNEEHEQFRWIRHDRVDNDFIWPSDRKAIAEICRDVLSPLSPTRELLRIPL